MVSRAKQVFFLSIYYISPIFASIIYWFEEPVAFPLYNSDTSMILIHRVASILGVFSFIWMCFNIIIMIKSKLIEKNFNIGGIIKFHTDMAIIAITFGAIHAFMVLLQNTYLTTQILLGVAGSIIIFPLMILAIIFMTNRLIKYKKIEKLRMSAFVMRFRYGVNKTLHNLTMLVLSVILIHTLISFTSARSMLIRSVYSFFFGITFISWIYHKLIRRFRSESDPYMYRKASWDVDVSEVIPKANKKWAFTLIKQNPSLYPCLQCGSCTEQCPVSEVTKGEYNPRRNILSARFGYKDLILTGDNLIIWGCTTCHTCEVVCPQNNELTETFAFLKNQSIAQGKGPDSIYEQMKSIFENAKAIPMQPAIENRRKQLKLPAIMTPDTNEVQILLRNLEIDRKIQTR